VRVRHVLASAVVVLWALPGVAPPVGAPAAMAASPAGARFTPIAPTRLADTRIRVGTRPAGRLRGGGTAIVRVTGVAGIPATATAVVLNVTATATSGPGFVTVWPAGLLRPLASTLNPERFGQTIPNLVTVRVGVGGYVALYTLTSTDLVVDAFGYYTPVRSARAGRYVPVGPVRAFDSRVSTGAIRARARVRVPLGRFVGKGGVAAVLNVTVTQARGPGYWTVYAAGARRPSTSNLNVVAGDTVANQVIVPVSAAGIDIFSLAGGHVVVDVVGWFTGPSAPLSSTGLFVPVTPARVLDSRSGGRRRLAARWTVEVAIAGRAGVGRSASAVVANTTLVNARGAGYTTVYPAGRPRPLASTLNAMRSAQLIANHTTSPLGTRGLALFSQTGSHLVVDVSGWYTGRPLPSVLGRPVNPPAAPPPPPTRLVLGRLGLDTRVAWAFSLADLGSSPGWLPGSGLPGLPGNEVIAGHRVSHTHPFLYIQYVRPGDGVDVYADGRYRYVVLGSVVIPASDTRTILAPTATPVLTLYACHPPHSVAFRYVVKAVYAGDG
jgi:hypothetical protein